MVKPCSNCPFRRDSNGIRLTEGRIEELTDIFLNGARGTFSCHKTNDYDDEADEVVEGDKTMHCAGALIFAEKNETPTQMMRICERLGMYDRTKLEPYHDLVFNDAEEMLETAV